MDSIQKARDDLERTSILFESMEETTTLTPLLKDELAVGCRTLKFLRDNDFSDVEMMESTRQDIVSRLQNHWAEVFKGLNETGWLFYNMRLYRVFLRQALLCDYTREPVPEYRLVTSFARARTAERRATDTNYDIRLIPLFKEMMVDREHAESKCDSVLPAGIYQSRVHSLVEDCRWDELALTICKDRVLATRLREQDAFPNWAWKSFLGGIDHLQKKYFDDLKDAQHFQPSQNARKATAERALKSPNPPAYSDLYGSKTDPEIQN